MSSPSKGNKKNEREDKGKPSGSSSEMNAPSPEEILKRIEPWSSRTPRVAGLPEAERKERRRRLNSESARRMRDRQRLVEDGMRQAYTQNEQRIQRLEHKVHELSAELQSEGSAGSVSRMRPKSSGKSSADGNRSRKREKPGEADGEANPSCGEDNEIRHS